jgi:hypothetical protein
MADNLNCQWQYQEAGSQKRTAAFQAAVLLKCAGHGTILAGESPVMGNLPLM